MIRRKSALPSECERIKFLRIGKLLKNVAVFVGALSVSRATKNTIDVEMNKLRKFVQMGVVNGTTRFRMDFWTKWNHIYEFLWDILVSDNAPGTIRVCREKGSAVLAMFDRISKAPQIVKLDDAQKEMRALMGMLDEETPDFKWILQRGIMCRKIVAEWPAVFSEVQFCRNNMEFITKNVQAFVDDVAVKKETLKKITSSHVLMKKLVPEPESVCAKPDNDDEPITFKLSKRHRRHPLCTAVAKTTEVPLWGKGERPRTTVGLIRGALDRDSDYSASYNSDSDFGPLNDAEPAELVFKDSDVAEWKEEVTGYSEVARLDEETESNYSEGEYGN